MTARSAQMLPPKMTLQFADRAMRGEGHRLTPESDIYEFPQGGNVVCIMLMGGNPTGHLVRDPRRAQQLRDAAIASQATP